MKTHYTVRYRRKREGKTDYKQRLRLLKSHEARLVVRKKLMSVVAQLVQYQPDGDKIITSAQTVELKKYGLPVINNNVATAYLTGLLLAKKAKEQNITTAVVDFGLQNVTDHSRLYAVVKGAIDGGLQIPADAEVLPSEDRVSGSHIESYAKALKTQNPEKYAKQFSAYLAEKIDPTAVVSMIAQVKKKLLTK